MVQAAGQTEPSPPSCASSFLSCSPKPHFEGPFLGYFKKLSNGSSDEGETSRRLGDGLEGKFSAKGHILFLRKAAPDSSKLCLLLYLSSLHTPLLLCCT